MMEGKICWLLCCFIQVLLSVSQNLYPPNIHGLQLPAGPILVNTTNLDRPIFRISRSISGRDLAKFQRRRKYTNDEIYKMFKLYYQCLKSQGTSSSMKSVLSAILALEGQRVELKCPICRRPDQIIQAFWQRVRITDASVSIIQKKMPGFRITRRMTLIIKSVDVSDAGQYFCIQRGDSVVIYQVDVLFREPLQTVWENNTKALVKNVEYSDRNLNVYTHWSEWSECDQCGKKGKRLKYGTCMVKRSDPKKPITPLEYDVPMLALYPQGVPCRSTVLSRKLANIEMIAKRPSQIIAGNCFFKCPPTPPSVIVTDKNGNKREIIEAGYYPLNRKPELPPMVRREARYEPSGKEIVIQCPTSNRGKVRWQRGERPINTATIRRQTKGRVFIDKLSRLHIRKARPHDSAPYACWEWQRHIATIKITVFEAFNPNIKRYITYGGLFVTIISIPLFCIYKLCFGKPKRRK